MLARRRAGDRVLVIAPGPRAPDDESRELVRIPSAGLFGPPGALPRLREKPWRAYGLLALALGVRRELERRGPFDEIIAHWLVPSAWPLSIGRAPRLEAVAHGSDVRLLGALPGVLRRHVARQLLAPGVRVRCVSEHVRSELLAATTPELGARASVAASPFELPHFEPSGALRARYGIAPSHQLVLIVGRLIPEKRVQVALDAVSSLPGARVVVVGGGPLQAQLEQAYPEVRFTGELPRPEALAWIAAADVLVSASRHEGAPTVVREARALGTPVVACPAGSLSELSAADAGIWLTDF